MSKNESLESPSPISERTLEQDIPDLKSFLYPGCSVLDVGCGPGTITVDVAEQIAPGRITGVDSDPRQIASALGRLEQGGRYDNARFLVADSHALPFADSTFDVVYSHTAVHFFLDPLRAINEQRRVVRSGGRVIVSGVRIWPHCIRYPECPNWDRVLKADAPINEAKYRDYVDSGLSPQVYLQNQLAANPTYLVYSVPNAGQHVAGWLKEAGLVDISVTMKPERLQYVGSGYMKPSVWDLLPEDHPTSPTEEQIKKNTERLISEGFLDLSTVEKAKQERDEWYRNPYAFFSTLLVFAAGRKQ